MAMRGSVEVFQEGLEVGFQLNDREKKVEKRKERKGETKRERKGRGLVRAMKRVKLKQKQK